MTIEEYVDTVGKRYKQGINTEHSYRGDLQQLVETLVDGIIATNEPKRQECGAPDYVITRKGIPLGYIEAKDVGLDLHAKSLQKQFSRYRHALENLIITDYLRFEYYLEGEWQTTVEIARIEGDKIIPLPQNYDTFAQLIATFCGYQGQTIRSARQLARIMAAKARLLADAIDGALTQDEKNNSENQEPTSLQSQLDGFKDILIHDITPREFADIYAQTIAYGMFAARLHDPSLSDFSRQEAAALIPKTNPFLRQLFQYIAGYDLDSRIRWIVDALADAFLHTDVRSMLRNFGKQTQQNDPIIHFYETFLAEYDPKLRKARGVWYTPEPVVNFIVRAVDDVLKDQFGLKDGLADRSKIEVERSVDQSSDKRYADNKKKEKRIYHKVQILDPATGTGTFLSEAVKTIHARYQSQQGMWNGYVQEHLIPRLNGFELLMASYAMAHLKLDIQLSETGFQSADDQRFHIYLTNSLEESHPDTGTFFATFLSREANAANRIKRDVPVMCVMGNPPYSGESANKGKWIMKLMEDYKKEPGGKIKLQERNPKWLNDDYVKFIRLGQHYIERNGEGVLAYINPHGYLDNPTFRGMRWNLLKTYDKIYVIDLHGNSKKKETCPDGSKDENVFDIMQGVSINIFVKTGKKQPGELAQVFHHDLYGRRQDKYDFLLNHSLATVPFQQLVNKAPMYYMVQKDFGLEGEYQKGFSVPEMFPVNSVGIVTARDSVLIDNDPKILLDKVQRYYETDVSDEFIKPLSYRPFDDKSVYYDTNLVERSREKVMQHFIDKDNLGLTLCRQFKTGNTYQHCFISDCMIESCIVSNKTSEITSAFPLYLYPDEKSKDLFGDDARRPNLDEKIVSRIAQKLKHKFTPEKTGEAGTFAPVDLLDYAYAVLHSPRYREKYKEFLKVDFPRVPYPADAEHFWQLVALGSRLRRLHLLADADIESITYPVSGNNEVIRPMGTADFEPSATDPTVGRVWINDNQYFDQVPLAAWNFYIGGYQPARKWLKDRRGSALNFDDIEHYERIVSALNQTAHLMEEIDKI